MIERRATNNGVIELGKQGENLAVTIVFDIKDWVQSFGEGTVQLLHRRNGDRTPYPCNVSVDGGMVRWAVTEADVAAPGNGFAELQYHVDAVCVKSVSYVTNTNRSLGAAGAMPPASQDSWVNKVLRAGAKAEQAAREAQKAAEDAWKAAQEIIDGGFAEDGKDGVDGISPIATVTQTDSGATIYITDKNGTTTASITNGKDGAQGPAGPKGDPGERGATGSRGPAGSDYVLTDSDKREIADIVLANFPAAEGVSF